MPAVPARARGALAGLVIARALLGIALVAVVLAGCTENAKPLARTCPTPAQTVTFDVTGSCPGAGTTGTVRTGVITLSTVPGLCDLDVANGAAVGLPSHGTFQGTAADTGYDLERGNWQLNSQSPDPKSDPSTDTCDATPGATSGTLLVTCSINACGSSGPDLGSQCVESTCVAHLTPHTADGGAPEGAAGEGGPIESGAADAITDGSKAD